MARRDRDRRKVEQALELLQSYLQVTKNEYEMYFMGIQKMPPKDKHRELKKMFRDLTELGIQNTAARFRLKVLRSRYNTLNVLWMRSVKQIEEGTYRKHRFMADAREARSVGQKVADTRRIKAEIRALARGVEFPEEEAPTVRDVPTVDEPKRARAPAPSRKSGSASRGHSVGSEALVNEYSAVRKQLGMDGRVNASALEARLRKHAEIVKERTGAREVKFRVVNEDGKPRLKAIPVK